MPSSANKYLVKDFGAIGDGLQNDTKPLQEAIDRCHQAGGGTVIVSPGNYLISTLILKSHVNLHLESGATLLASLTKEEYLFADASPEATQKTVRCGLIYACGQEDISLSGSGRITGQDKEFWFPKTTEEIGESWNNIPPRYWPKEWRPMLILFENCQNVLVEQVTFANSPVYTAWLIKCNHVKFSQVEVLNDFYGPNTDGFHLSSCYEVHISNCYFLTGDDSIAIDGNGSRPAEDTYITNCTFDSSVNCLRVYTGLDKDLIPENKNTSMVRNLAMTDCKVINAAGVINITAECGLIENLSFSNFEVAMKQEGTVIYMMNMEGRIRSVRFSHIKAQTNGAATIIGVPNQYLEAIELENLYFQITPKKKWHGLEMPDPVPAYGNHHFAPFSLFLRYVRDIHLKDVTIEWTPSETEAIKTDSLFKCRHVEHLLVENFKGIFVEPAPASPIMDWEDVQNSIVNDAETDTEYPSVS
jgi:polygalacturonase